MRKMTFNIAPVTGLIPSTIRLPPPIDQGRESLLMAIFRHHQHQSAQSQSCQTDLISNILTNYIGFSHTWEMTANKAPVIGPNP